MHGDSWRHQRDAQVSGRPKTRFAPAHVRSGLSLESLEPRLLLTVPAVVSIERIPPLGQNTAAASVGYTVTFNESVTNVAAADFRATTSGSLQVAPVVSVVGSNALYTVTISGIRGSGEVRLDLIDNDTIEDALAVPLGGVGLLNGSFQGKTYTVDQMAPIVLSIARAGPAALPIGATTAGYTVTFSEPVTGVDPNDFALVVTGGVLAASPVVVAGGPTVYSVTVNGISGSGTLALKLVDDNTIFDVDGNRLAAPIAAATFSAQVMPATGSVPNSVVGADLNADGKPDLVVANLFGQDVSVLIGNGNGTFQNQVTYSTGVDPSSALAKDVNGDGKLDLIVPNYFDTNVSVLLGNGDGTFQPQVLYPTSLNPVAAVVADISGDGKPDLVVANRGGNTLSVLLGNGNGTFQGQTLYATGLQPQSLVVADLNADGMLDVAVANSGNNNVSVLLGGGNGTLQPQVTYSTGSNPQSVATADFNGDGAQDLVVANFGGNSVSVLLGNGNGTFQSQTSVPTGLQPQGVVAADVNADGKPDLVVANSQSNTVGILLGNGNGSFQPQIATATGATPYAVAALDVNNDGRPDLVTANLFGANVSVLLGNAVGDFLGEVYTVTQPSTVAGRQLFYNQSAFDGNDAAINVSDDNAIATDKTAYLPNATIAIFANVSSYIAGINGIMIDLLGGGSHAAITAADFVFKAGRDNAPSSWSAAPAPTSISVRTGAGVSGSDRVEIIWGANAVKNQWLEVQVLATVNTGLTAPDVFFWGNKLGDTGTPSATDFSTTVAGDGGLILAGLGAGTGITNVRDIDRTNSVTVAGDRGTTIANVGTLNRLTVGAGGPFAPVAGRSIATPSAASSDEPIGIAAISATTMTQSVSSTAQTSSADGVSWPAPAAISPARIAAYFQHVAEQHGRRSRTASATMDRLVDDLGLDDELYGSLVSCCRLR